MHELLTGASALNASIELALEKLDIAGLNAELETLRMQSEQPDFWNDSEKAQQVMKEISRLNARVEPWQKIHKEVTYIVELATLNDESLAQDLSIQLHAASVTFEKMKEDLKFSGPYDDHDVIMNIHAGAGGTDAQDWAQMLLRMYVRWAESHKLRVQTIDESNGDEAGIKSATIEIGGSFVFGKLQGEHGVHRLVRLSPFNSDNLRQTSFAKVEVMPKIDKPDSVVIDEKDLKIDVYRAGGHGGQSVNTTDSAVRITHLPTGITAAIQNERSQLQNKETAMTIIRSRLAQLQLEQHTEAISELKGPNEQAAWGNQIRSYVLHPYKQVKDLRTRYETSDPDDVLSGNLDPILAAYAEYSLS